MIDDEYAMLGRKVAARLADLQRAFAPDGPCDGLILLGDDLISDGIPAMIAEVARLRSLPASRCWYDAEFRSDLAYPGVSRHQVPDQCFGAVLEMIESANRSWDMWNGTDPGHTWIEIRAMGDPGRER